jgi:endogenous inhibitor of DNA gyrase (YacG/DUF329 family)
MNKMQKGQIETMRTGGESYTAIASALGISVNTVKSFCRRNGLGAAAHADNGRCPQCGAMLTHTEGAKKRRFCSDRCRMAWWNTHPEAMRHGDARMAVCAHCGREFTAHGSRKRKYCSQECYRAARAGR